ncbi:MAG: hypothetical protein V7603_6818 [Micromonosporaceae bacterium]
MPEDDRVQQACAYLRMLLLRPGDYRARWESHAGSSDTRIIDAQAVAAVLGAFPPGPARRTEVMVGGRRAGAHPVLTRPSESLFRVARHALDGTVLHPADLELFIRAFGIFGRHAHRLRELRRGSPSVRAIYDDVLPPDEAYRHAGPPHYDTLALHELHTLGPDGRPAEHETIQVIKSTVPWLESVPYRFDTDELLVHMVRGGQVGPSVYRVNETIYGVDILLNQPLALGETALLQYHLTFAYKTQPPPRVRRGVLRSTEDLTIWVRFHPTRVPARVWSARWDSIDDSHIIDRQPAELDSELSVHVRFGRVEKSIVGFYWEWE